MKTLAYTFLLLLLLSFYSCEDEYVNFTKEEKELIHYEIGDRISFVTRNDSDTITLEVKTKTTSYNKFVNPFNLSLRDCYLPVCTTIFSNNDYYGEIVFFLLENQDLSSGITIEKNSIQIFQGVWGMNKDLTLETDEFYYTNCDPTHIQECDSLLYSKSKGIIRFTNIKENDVYTLIE